MKCAKVYVPNRFVFQTRGPFAATAKPTEVPGVNPDILKKYFDEQGENGFDYAYRFPGMNKVLQAAGRVIRTSDDVGIIALLDERFLQNSYIRLFPREWENYQEVGLTSIEKKVERFWDSWL